MTGDGDADALAWLIGVPVVCVLGFVLVTALCIAVLWVWEQIGEMFDAFKGEGR